MIIYFYERRLFLIDTVLKHWRALGFLFTFVPTVASPLDDVAKYGIVGVYSSIAYGQFVYSERKKEKEKSKEIEAEKETVKIESKKQEDTIESLQKELKSYKESLAEIKIINQMYHASYVSYRNFVLVEFCAENETLKGFTAEFQMNHGKKERLSKELDLLKKMSETKNYLYTKEKELIENVERDIPRRGDFR